MERVKVVLNEQHSLLEDQKRVLDDAFEDWELFPVPEEGWTYDEQLEVIGRWIDQLNELPREDELWAVFASPIPALMTLAARCQGQREDGRFMTLVFHNDQRVAKEISLPNGKKKVVHTVAPEGWRLV